MKNVGPKYQGEEGTPKMRKNYPEGATEEVERRSRKKEQVTGGVLPRSVSPLGIGGTRLPSSKAREYDSWAP